MSPSNKDGRQDERKDEQQDHDAPVSGSHKTSGDAASMPAAGPHAKPELTNDMSTPGAGALPDADDEAAGAQDSTTG